MSFGKSSSNSQSQAQATSSQTLDPQILSALLGNYAQAQTLNTPYQPYTGEQVAPLNATQLAAQQGVLGIAANDTGGAELNSAANTTAGVAGYPNVESRSSTCGGVSRRGAAPRSIKYSLAASSSSSAAYTASVSVLPDTTGP